jgi:electron transfer flavoprotein beta subunit|uniref:Electron transfer flavoprotein subunit beta n=1 Tax=Eutreptiella gymnastica TaxID=73025 RepID=A0A7S4CA48_9EUGL
MKALVAVKRVIDYTVKVRVRPDKLGVVKDNVKHSCNPFDEIAVEQAVRMKEKKILSEVTVVSIGGPKSADVLRPGVLAMGADKAIHVKLPTDDTEVEPIAVAKILQKIAEKVQPDMVIMGKQAIDDDSCASPQMLAALMDWPQGTFACGVEVADNKVKLARETDAGVQNLELNVPCVLSCDLRLNEPRYAKLPEIMKAKKKPFETIDIKDLGVDITPRLKVVEVAEPPTRSAGVKVGSIEEMVDKLKNEAKVL